MKKNLLIFIIVLLFNCSGKKETTETTETTEAKEIPKGFVTVKGTHFEIDGKPYYYLGANFWYGLNLGSKGAGGDRERLLRELDQLKNMNVTNLRVVAGSEGPDTEPWRMAPALQTEPGKYNEEVLDGLDFLLDEMRKRDMKAVMCLNDFWPWSGGMGQYLVWAGAADSIPYPPPHPGGSWDAYPKFTAQFYSNPKAMELFNNHIQFIVNRKNPYSGVDYKSDPTIMAWELANEPRGVNNIDAYVKWIDSTSAFIKKLDPHHLVTTGSEGNTSSSASSGTNLEKDHSSKNIDYTTIHIWVQNWGWFDPMKADETYPNAVDMDMKYFDEHLQISKKLNKPMVLEEFGISRDLNNHVANTPTTMRDKYYGKMFEKVYNESSVDSSVVAGCNFWAWGGEGRPRVPEGFWKAGDDFIGDPPHEAQGWYSVYNNDSSTIAVIKDYAGKMKSLGNK